VFLKVELCGATALAARQFKDCLSLPDPKQPFLPPSNSTSASIQQGIIYDRAVTPATECLYRRRHSAVVQGRGDVRKGLELEKGIP